MTEIPTIPLAANRHLKLPRLCAPKLAIGASLTAMSALIGEVFKLAYVAPYTSHDRQPRVAPDDDLEGRDPSW